MNTTTPRMPNDLFRRTVYLLLTFLLLGCLLVAIYVWHIAYAKRMAQDRFHFCQISYSCEIAPVGSNVLSMLINDWDNAPCYGRWLDIPQRWMPKRENYELLLLLTRGSIPNDPDAWRVWLEAHPQIQWDKNDGHFVAKPIDYHKCLPKHCWV